MPVGVFILQFSKLNVVLIGLTNNDGQANDCEQVFDHDRHPVVCGEYKCCISLVNMKVFCNSLIYKVIGASVRSVRWLCTQSEWSSHH